jgi:hypothetical protein
MSAGADRPDDPRDAEVVGVPPETPPAVEPSATGLVPGPVVEETEVDVADVRLAPSD